MTKYLTEKIRENQFLSRPQRSDNFHSFDSDALWKKLGFVSKKNLFILTLPGMGRRYSRTDIKIKLLPYEKQLYARIFPGGLILLPVFNHDLRPLPV